MPNAKVLESKKAIVDALAERMQSAQAGVFVDYKGITVAQDTDLRNKLRDAGVEYTVVKNTLTRFACNKIGYTEFDELFNGTTSLATSTTDCIAPCRVINEYAKKLTGKFEIKGGFVEGKVLSVDEIKELSALASKDALLSQVLGTFLAPITSLAVVLNQIAEAGGGSAAASEATTTEEAAPAEEAAPEAAPVEEAAPEAAPVEEAAPTEEAAPEAAE